MAVWKNKTGGEKTGAMVGGIATMVIANALCYTVGAFIGNSDSFYDNTGTYLDFSEDTVPYILCCLIGGIASLVVYIINFNNVAGRKDTQYSFAENAVSSVPPVFKGWGLGALLSGVLCLILSFIVYLIGLRETELLLPLCLILWLVTSAINAVVFFIPAFKPLKLS